MHPFVLAPVPGTDAANPSQFRLRSGYYRNVDHAKSSARTHHFTAHLSSSAPSYSYSAKRYSYSIMDRSGRMQWGQRSTLRHVRTARCRFEYEYEYRPTA